LFYQGWGANLKKARFETLIARKYRYPMFDFFWEVHPESHAGFDHILIASAQ
jgi:hypothetical protein